MKIFEINFYDRFFVKIPFYEQLMIDKELIGMLPRPFSQVDSHFVKWYDTVQVQSNTEGFLSFTSYLFKVGLGGVRLLNASLLGKLDY